MTTDTRIETRRSHLTKERAERLDPLDYPRVWTMRQCNTYEAETVKIDQQSAAFNTTVETWAALPPLEPLTRWCDFMTTARDTLSAERLQIRSPIRDRAVKAQADDLEFCLKLIDQGFRISRLGIETLAPTAIGQLMQAAGFAVSGPELRGPNGWGGSLPEVEARIKELTKRRTAAEAALDAALLDDMAIATLEAESQAHRETLKTMRLALSSDGTALVAYTDDDEVLAVSAMSDAQRRAFEWHSRAFAPRETVST